MRVLTSDVSTGGCSVWQITEDLRLRKEFSFGCKGRPMYVQKMVQFAFDGKKYILVGRKGLTLDIYDMEDFRCVKTKHLMTTQADSDFFVTLEVFDEQEFKACTGLGYCYFLSLETLLTSCYNDFSMSFGLHGPVSFFKFLPRRTTGQPQKKIIVGGKDRELAVIELETHTNVWKSKAVKKEKSLDGVVQRDPIWVQDVAVIPLDGDETDSRDDYRIIAATRFGKLLSYDPNIGKVPLDEIQVSENPIKHIHYVGNMILVADSFRSVVLVDKSLKVVNKLRIPLGPLSSIATFPLEADRHTSSRFIALIASSSDKRLRLYVFEDGCTTCMDTVDADSIVPDMVMLDTEDLPHVLEEWLAEEEPAKRHRI